MNSDMNKEWVEINLPYGPVYMPGLKQADSFSLRELNNPGTLIRMEGGAEYLIGHINELRGVCDDCTEFRKELVVVAYKVIWKG